MNPLFNEAEAFRYLILAVQRQGNRMLKTQLKHIGVTPSQAEVISILKTRQPITLKALGKLLICEDGSPSRLIERMVKGGLIKRIKDEKDSRYIQLALTSLGEEKYSLIIEAEIQLYKTLENIYTKEELQQTNNMLSKLLSGTPLFETMVERGFNTIKALNERT
ncbi:MarR family winged helix-turn-helix transcriptional regulator [Heyndrickxia ginsengihumi]|uniref:MarR family winged helix-turn-helix transcriptional regulator n=1 Tax=Heyndrickxia ginsengihumi TaxID=363870 RepID=UPI003D1D3073